MCTAVEHSDDQPWPSPYPEPLLFEDLAVQYRSHIHAVAFSVLHDWQEAEDMTQEVLLKVFQRLGDLSHPQAVWSWLRRITVNACLDLMSYRRRRPMLVSLTSPDHADEPAYSEALRCSSAEEIALGAEEWRAFQAALGRLEPGACDALLLRDLHGYSYAEIAELRNVSLSAAKMRVHRARRAVQRSLVLTHEL